MSRSKHQYHPEWRSKAKRHSLKFKKTKMKPYGMQTFVNYGNAYFKGGEEREYTRTVKGKERKNNKLDIYIDYSC